MKAIVLAAGHGTRLRPLTDERPKHLMEIGGKAILHRILSQLSASEFVDEIVVVVNYEMEQIKAAVKTWFPNKVDITFVDQKSADGTGDAVDTALQVMDISTNFAVINGDVLFAEPLTNFLQKGQSSALIVGAEVDDPRAFGVLEHENLNLQSIVEKPDNAPDDALINAGFYVFPAHAKSLFADLKLSSRGEREITDVLDKLLQEDTTITVYPTTDGWFDIGKPWEILNANEFFMDREQDEYNILTNLEPNVQIHGNVHIAESARVRSGTYIEGPVYIDEGADIGPNCYIRSRSYLGKDTRVGNGCEVKNSVIYEDSHAAHLSYIGDSVIGRSCNLGAGTITANLRHDGEDVRVTIKENRISSDRRKLGVIMGDQVKTGIGVDLLPGVKLSSGTWINAGEVVNRDR